MYITLLNPIINNRTQVIIYKDNSQSQIMTVFNLFNNILKQKPKSIESLEIKNEADFDDIIYTLESMLEFRVREDLGDFKKIDVSNDIFSKVLMTINNGKDEIILFMHKTFDKKVLNDIIKSSLAEIPVKNIREYFLIIIGLLDRYLVDVRNSPCVRKLMTLPTQLDNALIANTKDDSEARKVSSFIYAKGIKSRFSYWPDSLVPLVVKFSNKGIPKKLLPKIIKIYENCPNDIIKIIIN